MAAVSSKTGGVSAPARCVQMLQFVLVVISTALQSVLIILKSMYHMMRPQPAKSLVGEIILVTGAGHGIGRQLALEFWEHGCTVICVDIDEYQNNLTVHDINTRHRHRLEAEGKLVKDVHWPAHGYKCDVKDRNQVYELAQQVQKKFGRVDILVNNAGIMPVQPMLRVQPADVVDVVNANLLSHFWTVLAFLPGMVNRNHGHIVAVSSIAGLCGLANKVPYSASKSAVTGMMDALSEELRLNSHNIKLTCAHPYFVHTRTDLPEQLDLRIPELSPEQAASEIVNAVVHERDTVTVPRNLLFWLSVFRTLPQDARDLWRDLFHARVIPNPSVNNNQVSNMGVKT